MKKRIFLSLQIVFIGLSVFVVFELFSNEALAADASSTAIEKEQELVIKAKKKLYPGGADEGEIKVQSVLTLPKRKISPALPDGSPTEAEEAPEPETH